MPYDTQTPHPEAVLDAKPPIPTELFRGMSDLERALFYIAQKDANEQRIARSGFSGVSWSGMTSDRSYRAKSYEQMLSEARAQVERQG